MRIPQIPLRPTRRYFVLTLVLALSSLVWRGCDFLDTHDVIVLEKYIRRVASETRTSTLAP